MRLAGCDIPPLFRGARVVAKRPPAAWHAGHLAKLSLHRCSVFRRPDTGAVVPWLVKVGGDLIEQPVLPAICTNDEIVELQAALAGRVIAQLAGVTAAPYIRSGQLTPILIDHLSDRASYFVYFGSRVSQPARARAFIDLAVRRLVGNNEYVLSEKELRTRRLGSTSF